MQLTVKLFWKLVYEYYIIGSKFIIVVDKLINNYLVKFYDKVTVY